jgi:hypothetical protein
LLSCWCVFDSPLEGFLFTSLCKAALVCVVSGLGVTSRVVAASVNAAPRAALRAAPVVASHARPQAGSSGGGQGGGAGFGGAFGGGGQQGGGKNNGGGGGRGRSLIFFFFFFLLLLLLLLVCSSFLADTFAQSELSNFAARALQDAIRECLQGIFSGVQGGSQITAGSVSEAQCQTAMDCLKGIASKQIAGLGIYDSVFGVDPVQRQMQAQKAAREMMDKATTSRNPCAEKPKVASVNSPKLPPLPGVKE